MTTIAIQSNLGRDYTVSFITGINKDVTKNVTLKAGLNLISAELWDMIKEHPMVSRLLETDHTSCIVRERQVALGSGKDAEKNKNYQLSVKNYSEHKTVKMIEVKDPRDVVNTKKKVETKANTISKEHKTGK